MKDKKEVGDMKVTVNYFNSQIEKPKTKCKITESGAAKASTGKIVKVQDSITISGKTEETEGLNFASALALELKGKVREKKSDEQLVAIENKIANGNYVIDADEIAKKILLRG